METTKELGLYTDEQVQAGVKELFAYDKFVMGMKQFLPSELSDLILRQKDKVRNSFEFQGGIVHPLLQFLKKASMRALTSSGLDQLNPHEKYLFISNHRDIGLDSAFLNLLLYDNGFTTSQIAIGDNLMKHRVAELIFRINKSFVVQRSGNPRALYQASVNLSSYISETISSGTDSVWIAQREGRAKDGNDQTQIGVLKMLGLSGRKNELEHFVNLNIVPVAISYEYDPCDFLKTKEYYDRLNNSEYQKTFDADMASILQGLKGKKGKVHVSFGQSISTHLKKEDPEQNSKQILEKIARAIDFQIHQHYKLNPINYIAYDLLNSSDKFKDQYSQEELKNISAYFKERLEKINLVDNEEARSYLLGIYANPLANKLK